MDDQLLRDMAWMSYAMNQAIKELKDAMIEAGYRFDKVITLNNGLFFCFENLENNKLHSIPKFKIAEAVTWDYFDLWLDDEIRSLTGRPRR